MNVRLTRTPLVLATVILTGSFAWSQQTPPAPAANAPAPVERRPVEPNMRPGMHSGMMQGHMRPGSFHSNMHGGEMGDSFHIGPAGMWWKNPSVVERLSLTAEQTKKMDDIFQQSRLELIDLHADVQKQEVLLEPLLSANPLDSAKAMAQIDKVADARANLEKADAKMLLGIRSVLTPEQWTKLRTRGSGGPGAGGQGGPGGGRGMRGGGPGPGASNLVAPIGQP